MRVRFRSNAARFLLCGVDDSTPSDVRWSCQNSRWVATAPSRARDRMSTHSSSGGNVVLSGRMVMLSSPRANRASGLLPACDSPLISIALTIGTPFHASTSTPRSNLASRPLSSRSGGASSGIAVRVTMKRSPRSKHCSKEMAGMPCNSCRVPAAGKGCAGRASSKKSTAGVDGS